MKNIVNRHITLVSEKKLDKDVVRDWYNCVKQHSPEGVISSIEDAVLIHRVEDKKHKYIIPLYRELNEDEANKIVYYFTSSFPDIDFDIEASIPNISTPVKTIDVSQEEYDALCAAWAKKQHEEWYAQRSKEGWRYGTKMSVSQKTNPLMRPWGDLPEQYRKIDKNKPQELINMLSSQGYQIVSKDEIDAIKRLLRGIS